MESPSAFVELFDDANANVNDVNSTRPQAVVLSTETLHSSSADEVDQLFSMPPFDATDITEMAASWADVNIIHHLPLPDTSNSNTTSKNSSNIPATLAPTTPSPAPASRKRPKSATSTPSPSPRNGSRGTSTRPTDATDDDQLVPEDTTKPRKPTYLIRKEEKQSLDDEIRLLEARLELLKMKNGHYASDQTRKTLTSIQNANFELEEAIHSNLLGVARFHSLLARHLHSIPVNPMKTLIHLSKSVPERRATLRAMRAMKLRRALELASDRMRFIDPCKPYMTEERYMTEDGTYHCKRFEIIPFYALRSAKQVYDALLFYLSNMEMAVSELLGQLTIREDMDVVEPTIWNHRIVTATGNGCFQESNTVGFAQFFDNYEPHGGAQHGVVAADSVDVDDLYPYVPRERVRKDVTAALTVSEWRDPTTNELVVVLRRCVFLSLHKPQIEVPPSAMDEMQANIATWCTIMGKFLRDSLTPIQGAATAM